MASMSEVNNGTNINNVHTMLNESTGNISEFDSGAYLYNFSSGKFDVDKFNRVFDQYIDKRKNDQKIREQLMLKELNKKNPPIPLFDLPLGSIMINTKDVVFNTMSDILGGNLTTNVFVKENRLFYFGVLFICIAVLVYFYYILLSKIDEPDVPKVYNINIAIPNLPK